jgi:uncharacterized protein YkwD
LNLWLRTLEIPALGAGLLIPPLRSAGSGDPRRALAERWPSAVHSVALDAGDSMIRNIAILAVAIVFVIAAAPASTQDQKPDPFALTKEEKQVVELTNAAREKEGLKPLKVSPKLCEVARAYSVKMAKAQKVDHFLDNTKVGQRAKAAGYFYSFIGENLGAGNFPVAKIFQAWMDSKLHRENILEKKFLEIGVGIYRDEKGESWYTQIFAVPK